MMQLENIELKNMFNITEKFFLHYTSMDNLQSISLNGLQPKIGKNSKVIEKSKKVFFTEGAKGALVIMDVWLKWLVAKPICNFIYYIGAFLLKVPIFPKIIHKTIIRINQNKKKYEWSYRKLKTILDDSVYLVMNLEENIDFNYNDVDEVKKFYHCPKWFTEKLYSNDSNVLDEKMEYWNMHTISNKIIEPSKLKVLKINGNIKASEILKYLIENNLRFVKDNFSLLYEYYNYIYLN